MKQLSCTGKFKYDMIWKISYISENKKRNYNFRHPPCNGTERRFPVVPAFTSWGLVDPAALLVMLGEGGGDHCHWDGSDENATQHWNLIKSCRNKPWFPSFFPLKKEWMEVGSWKMEILFLGSVFRFEFFCFTQVPIYRGEFLWKKRKMAINHMAPF